METKKRKVKRKRGNREKIIAFKRRNKQFIIFGTFITSIIFLFFNLMYINIVHGDEYQRRAIRQQVNHRGIDIPINPNRGSILDRNGQVLGASTTVYNIILDVRELYREPLHVQEHTIDTLYNILGVPKEEVWGYLEENPETGKPMRDTHYLILQRQVQRALANELMEEDPKRVWLEDDTLRTYSHGNLAGPLVGFTRANNSSWGLERQYDEELTGVPGRLVRMFDETGYAYTQSFRPQTGYTLITTIDLAMQQIAQEATQTYGSMYNAERSSVIIMEPNTGEVLAMAQYPTFDPNEPFNIEHINSQRSREELMQVPEEQLMNELFGIWANHTITYSFEPGSIFKPVIAAAALEEGLVGENEVFHCPGYVDVGDRRIHCWNRNGHGYLSLSQSIAMSCNVSIIQLGERLGRQAFYDYKMDFGVGQLTGIDLHGEVSVAPLTYSLNQLNPVELATSSMGQGFNMTPLQAINSFAAVINGGNLMQPYVVSQIVDTQGNIISENTPTVKRSVVSQETSDFWREQMVHTLDSGTGSQANIEGYLIGGKTGTAEQGVRGSGVYTLSFVSYFPADNPQYIILAMIDRPEPYTQGVTTIQPMIKSIMEDIIRYKAIPPNDLDNSIDLSIGNSTILIEDYVGQTLNDSTRNLNEKGLVFDVIGNGNIITSQMPLAGSRVAPGSRVFLYLSNEDLDEELILLPNVEGMTISQAQETLSNLNFDYVIIEAQQEIIEDEDNTEISNINSERVVIEQMPSSGIRVLEGTEISLVIR